MSCINDGMLRAFLDGELGDQKRMEVKEHCNSCEKCRHRAEQISRDAESVRGLLATLAPPQGEVPPDARTAFARLRQSKGTFQGRPSWVASLFAKRLTPAWVSLVLMAVIGIFLAFAPARSWAQRVLGLLRVQRIATVPIDFEALSKSRAQVGKTIQQLLSDDVVFTQKAGEPEEVATAEEASKIAGFKVRLLGKTDAAPKLKVWGEQSFHLTLDRDRLQSILEEAGRSDLKLPFSVDGATIAAHIQKIVFAQYAGTDDSIVLVQSLGPTVNVPPELNMAELAEVALQLAGMSPETAHQFSQSVDWTTTLVLGIPQGTVSKMVEVDGVEGTLIEERARGDRPSKHSLAWVKDGMVYALSVSGDDVDVLTLAKSLN